MAFFLALAARLGRNVIWGNFNPARDSTFFQFPGAGNSDVQSAKTEATKKFKLAACGQ
jgi:hypothetical protein